MVGGSGSQTGMSHCPSQRSPVSAPLRGRVMVKATTWLPHLKKIGIATHFWFAFGKPDHNNFLAILRLGEPVEWPGISKKKPVPCSSKVMEITLLPLPFPRKHIERPKISQSVWGIAGRRTEKGYKIRCLAAILLTLVTQWELSYSYPLLFSVDRTNLQLYRPRAGVFTGISH